jgi:hypothetical protein
MFSEHITQLKVPFLLSDEKLPEVELWSSNPMMVASFKDTKERTTKVSISEPPMSELAKRVKIGFGLSIYNKKETEKIILDWYCEPTNFNFQEKMRNIRDLETILRIIGEHQGIDKNLYEVPDVFGNNKSMKILQERPELRFIIIKKKDTSIHESFWINTNISGSLYVQEKFANGFAGNYNIIDNESKSIRYASIGDLLVENYSGI